MKQNDNNETQNKTEEGKMKQCADCRDGEHDNIDEYVELVYVRDPDTKKMVKRSYMCEEHQSMYLDDGYEVKVC